MQRLLGSLVLAAASVPALSAPASDASDMTTAPLLRVSADDGPAISPLMFGQFLEIASWGELGPEAFADPETGELPDHLVEKLRELDAPLIRFPAGSDLPFLDWTDRIRMPGRPEQPISEERGDGKLSNRFTFDHFLRLCEELEAEPMLVVKATPGITGESPIGPLAEQAAALVAYCNAELRPGMDPAVQKWAALRAANGRFEPYGVKYWQVGNELFFATGFGEEHKDFWKHDTEIEKQQIADGVVTVLTQIAKAMQRVDPDLVLITDGEFADKDGNRLIAADPRMRDTFPYLTNHKYGPWEVKKLKTADGEIEGSDLDAETVHWFTTFFPTGLHDDGRSRAFDDWIIGFAEEFGYQVAGTEWNWNGWGSFDDNHPYVAAHGRALGTAGFLNGMFRQAEHLGLATQSMMLGESWNIAAVKADRDDPHNPAKAYVSPSGRATAFYNAHHGARFRASELSGLPEPKALDLTHGEWKIAPAIPLLEAAVTADPDRVFLHVVNRAFDAETPLRIELDGIDAADITGIDHHTLVSDPTIEEPFAATVERTVELDPAAVATGAPASLEITLPAASVSIVAVRLGADAE